jgi:hypothetical protein
LLQIFYRKNYLKDKWLEGKTTIVGGNKILLKAVAQAIPVYAMSVFLIPKEVCKSMMDTKTELNPFGKIYTERNEPKHPSKKKW